MDVVPTSDGEDDDGVIWFRCPQCQGFLPKLSGAELQTGTQDDSGLHESSAEDDLPDPVSSPDPITGQEQESVLETSASPPASSSPARGDETLPWDSPADMMAANRRTADDGSPTDLSDGGEDKSAMESEKEEPPTGPKESAEPIHEYAALLAEKDQGQPIPYRPWESYEVGQCIHHQAWEDCGVVVAREKLPGGRQVIKCYFEEAGVVRLIEKASR